MKRIMYLLFAISFFSCGEKTQVMCEIKQVPPQYLPANAIGLTSAIWQKDEVFVFHDGGTISQKTTLINDLRRWNLPGLKFTETTNRQQSDIRVGYNPSLGNWSYLGSQAKFIPKDQNTMNIANSSSGPHEGGHAIGAQHEHHHKNKGWSWIKPNVNRDLAGSPNFWSQAQIDFNFYRVLGDDNEMGDYDRKSCMHYGAKANWTTLGVIIPTVRNPSAKEKAFWATKYPADKKPVDPCEGILCAKGFSCVNGECIAPTINTCANILCSIGFTCVDGKCVKNEVDCDKNKIVKEFLQDQLNRLN